MQWIEISIVCERVATDEVTTLFDDYTDNGIIEEDVEDQPNLIKLTMYAYPSLDMDMIKTDLEKRLAEDNIKVISIDTDIIDESTWLNSWQQYIEPTEILPNIVIKPAWQEYDNVDNKTVIEIDSDISFGTGAHETTRTCAELLKIYSAPMDLDKVTCLDIGTGTGILLLIAAHLGIKKVSILRNTLQIKLKLTVKIIKSVQKLFVVI